jgi:hypothetical protein
MVSKTFSFDFENGKQGSNSQISASDLVMLALFNARERDSTDWTALFADVDQRFEFVGITDPPGSALSIIQARWKDV